jgi:tight adherence protein C
MTEFFSNALEHFTALTSGNQALAEGWPWMALAVAAVAAVWVVLRIVSVVRPKAAAAVAGGGDIPFENDHDGIFGGWTDAFASQLPESKKEAVDFAHLLRQAGMYHPAARASIYALRFVLLIVPLVVAGTVAVILTDIPAWQILVAGGLVSAALSIIPRLYVFIRRTRRLLEIRQGLADMMDMMGMCLSGGLPLSQSLEHVARNLAHYPALAEELLILKRQAEVSSLKSALKEFAARIDIPEVRQVASLLMRGEQFGTRLTDSLNDQADHFRATRRQVATTQANKTPVKLVLPLLFCFAPAALILLISPALLEMREFINPENRRSVLSNNEVLTTRSVFRGNDVIDQGAGTAEPSVQP